MKLRTVLTAGGALLAATVMAHKTIEDDAARAAGEEALDKLDEALNKDDSELDPIEKAKKYAIEIFFAILFFITIVKYWIGSSTNQKLAHAWHKKMLPLIQDNFLLVGLEDGINETALE